MTRLAWIAVVLFACGDDSGIVDSAMVDAGVVDATVDGTVDASTDAPVEDASTDIGTLDARDDAPDVAPGCTPTAATETRTLDYDGAEREYVLHVPASATPSNALVFDLHGFTETPDRQDGRSDMRAKADLEGFVLVQPRGQGSSWNGGACCGAASQDDVGLLRAIADAIAVETCIDRARVYVAGMSNGGFLAYRAACEAADFVAAIAPVAGVLGIDESACTPSRPVPVMHFHGTSDFIVPYDGNAFLSYPSVDDTIAFWRSTNSCGDASSITYDEGNTECETWACAADTEVTLCTSTGFGHDWPDGGSNIDATDAMWSFFERHRLP